MDTVRSAEYRSIRYTDFVTDEGYIPGLKGKTKEIV